MAGNKIVGLNVQLDFPSKQVHINMKSYVNNLLLSLNRPMPKKPQLCRSLQHRSHMAKKTSTRQMKTHQLLCCQNALSSFKKNIGFLLYYGQAVDNKVMVALNAISAWQAKVTVHTEQLVETLQNYVPTYPNNGIVYRVSDMEFCAHADAGYLNKTWSCSRADAHTSLLEDDPTLCFNSTVLTIATIIKFVMALAAEAELAALFIAACKMVPCEDTTLLPS